ncbi:hypothetical protein [Pseudidiomarina woesei]|nr:hypothetical protein [Pseudidiomarina woesei]
MLVVRTAIIMTLFIGLLTIAGCSTNSGVELLGQSRSAIEPSQVKLVELAPAAAEPIAKITSNFSYGVRETDESKRSYAIERALVQAAKLGANIMVIDKIEYQQTTSGGVTGGLYDGQTVSAVPAQRTPVVHATAYYLE